MSPLSFYKCLSEDTRLKCLLLITAEQEVCVCDLTQTLQLSQPKVSRHLAELRKCGIVQDERRGKWVFYALNKDIPDWARNVLQETLKNTPDYCCGLLDTLKRLKKLSNCC